MKIVISHGKTKRKIEGSFELCLSKADLEDLSLQIRQEVARRERDQTSYGWFTIRDEPKTLINTPPKDWDE